MDAGRDQKLIANILSDILHPRWVIEACLRRVDRRPRSIRTQIAFVLPPRISVHGQRKRAKNRRRNSIPFPAASVLFDSYPSFPLYFLIMSALRIREYENINYVLLYSSSQFIDYTTMNFDNVRSHRLSKVSDVLKRVVKCKINRGSKNRIVLDAESIKLSN